MRDSTIALSGDVVFKVKRQPANGSFRQKIRSGVWGGDCPRLWKIRNLPNLLRGAWRYGLSRLFNLPTILGELYVKVVRADGTVVDYGLVSMRVVTNNGVGYIVDAFQNLVELENMKYHGLGTTNTAEAAADGALAAELSTAYNPDNTRATGTTEEGASGNIFKTVATNTVDGVAAVVEHGVFSQAATGGGVLLDRSVFTVINLAASDSLQSTYQLTFTAGS